MILLKPGVKLDKLSPQLLLGLIIALPVFSAYASPLYITSIDDGKHGKNTLHGLGYAADLRIWYLRAEDRPRVVQEMRSRMGPDFDIVLEPDHIHVEYDPKHDAEDGPVHV